LTALENIHVVNLAGQDLGNIGERLEQCRIERGGLGFAQVVKVWNDSMPVGVSALHQLYAAITHQPKALAWYHVKLIGSTLGQIPHGFTVKDELVTG
jgi:hypothetical protein